MNEDDSLKEQHTHTLKAVLNSRKQLYVVPHDAFNFSVKKKVYSDINTVFVEFSEKVSLENCFYTVKFSEEWNCSCNYYSNCDSCYGKYVVKRTSDRATLDIFFVDNKENPDISEFISLTNYLKEDSEFISKIGFQGSPKYIFPFIINAFDAFNPENSTFHADITNFKDERFSLQFNGLVDLLIDKPYDVKSFSFNWRNVFTAYCKSGEEYNIELLSGIKRSVIDLIPNHSADMKDMPVLKLVRLLNAGDKAYFRNSLSLIRYNFLPPHFIKGNIYLRRNI